MSPKGTVPAGGNVRKRGRSSGFLAPRQVMLSDSADRLGRSLPLPRLSLRVLEFRNGLKFRDALDGRDKLRTLIVRHARDLVLGPDCSLPSGDRLSPPALLDLVNLICPAARSLFVDFLTSTEPFSPDAVVRTITEIFNKLLSVYPNRAASVQFIISEDGRTIERVCPIGDRPATAMFDAICGGLVGAGVRFYVGLVRGSQYAAVFSGPDVFHAPGRPGGAGLCLVPLMVLTDADIRRRSPVVHFGCRLDSVVSSADGSADRLKGPMIFDTTPGWMAGSHIFSKVEARLREFAQTSVDALYAVGKRLTGDAVEAGSAVLVPKDSPVSQTLLCRLEKTLRGLRQLPTRDSRRILLHAMSGGGMLLRLGHSVSEHNGLIAELSRNHPLVTELDVVTSMAKFAGTSELSIAERLHVSFLAFELLTGG